MFGGREVGGKPGVVQAAGTSSPCDWRTRSLIFLKVTLMSLYPVLTCPPRRVFTKHKYRGSKRTKMTKQCRKHCYDHLTHVAWMNLAEIVDEWSRVFFSKRPFGQKTQTTWTNVIWYMCAIKYRERMLFKVVTEKYIYRRKKCLVRGLSWWFLFGVAS